MPYVNDFSDITCVASTVCRSCSTKPGGSPHSRSFSGQRRILHNSTINAIMATLDLHTAALSRYRANHSDLPHADTVFSANGPAFAHRLAA
eukprot:scaffold658414_cov85-Prasinocladus_malaysianus.AAC.1